MFAVTTTERHSWPGTLILELQSVLECDSGSWGPSQPAGARTLQTM